MSRDRSQKMARLIKRAYPNCSYASVLRRGESEKAIIETLIKEFPDDQTYEDKVRNDSMAHRS